MTNCLVDPTTGETPLCKPWLHDSAYPPLMTDPEDVDCPECQQIIERGEHVWTHLPPDGDGLLTLCGIVPPTTSLTIVDSEPKCAACRALAHDTASQLMEGHRDGNAHLGASEARR